MDTYMEFMVKRPMTTADKVKRIWFMVLIAFAAIGWFLFLGVQIISYAFFIIGVVLVLFYIYFVVPGTDIEFEYLYLDKEITVDKILGKEKRKTMGVYAVDKIELMCPSRSERGAYKNAAGNLMVYNYTSRTESDEYEPYDIFLEGNVKIVLDLPVDFVKMVQTNAPRKVFLD